MNQPDKWRNKLEELNLKIKYAFEQGRLQDLLQYYDPGAVCMPEYHPALYSKNDIQQYYRQWFDAAKIISYQRNIYSVQKIEDYLVEIGTFTNTFQLQDKPAFVYNGKYLNIWKIGRQGDLQLISEIWGANQRVDDRTFSFIKIYKSTIPSPIAGTIASELKARNTGIAQMVTKREGKKHATEIFSNDAMYLTYDTTMLIGMPAIKPYFEAHERPDGVSIDSIQISAGKIIPLGEYVIEYGYYYVDVSWDQGKGSAIVKGKSTNIWRRNKNKVFMMYRQMVNHD